MKNVSRTFRYSRLFKQEVINEIRKENLTVKEAGRFYQVPFQTIYKWLKKEDYPNPKQEVFYVSLSKKHDILKKNEKLEEENQKLKSAIAKLTLDKICLEALVKVAEREYKVDLKKKSGIQQSSKSES